MSITESKQDDFGPYTEVWHCEQPPLGALFTVDRQEWKGPPGSPIRHIYAVTVKENS